MDTRFVLIGGTGFFGRNLREALLERGATVLTASRGRRATSPRAPDSSRGPDIRITLPEELSALKEALRPGDRVVYLVAATPLRRPLGGRKVYRERHLLGFARVLEMARSRGVAHVTYTSALGVTLDAGAAYAETKARAERLLARSRIAGSVVAPSILFGPGSEIVAALALLSRLPVVPLPDIGAPFRPIHVYDAARIVAEAIMQENPPERLELSGPEALSFAEVAQVYLEARGRRTLLIPRGLSAVGVTLASRIKLPGAPAELEAMLSIDNAGAPPENPAELVRFTEWVRG